MPDDILDKKSLETFLKILCSTAFVIVHKAKRNVPLIVTKCAPIVKIITEAFPSHRREKKTQITANSLKAIFDSSKNLVFDLNNMNLLRLTPDNWIVLFGQQITTMDDWNKLIENFKRRVKV